MNTYYVYILLSSMDGKLYIGSTPDLKKRLEKHNRGYVLATKHRRPVKLIYYESYLHPPPAQGARRLFQMTKRKKKRTPPRGGEKKETKVFPPPPPPPAGGEGWEETIFFFWGKN